jgi:hypothetical protein
LAAVSFKTLFFCPCPCRFEVREYINAKLLGLYIAAAMTQSIISFNDKLRKGLL